jgi:hypothetical protein
VRVLVAGDGWHELRSTPAVHVQSLPYTWVCLVQRTGCLTAEALDFCRRVVADPGMQVVLVAMPSGISSQILSRYGLNSSSSSSGSPQAPAGRRLLQASPPPPPRPPPPSPPAPFPPPPAPVQLLDYDMGTLVEPLPADTLAGLNASAAPAAAGSTTPDVTAATTAIGPFCFDVPQADGGWGPQQGLLSEPDVIVLPGKCLLVVLPWQFCLRQHGCMN